MQRLLIQLYSDDSRGARGWFGLNDGGVIGSGRKAVIVMARGRFGCSCVAHILRANLRANFVENWDACYCHCNKQQVEEVNLIVY
jgi:hypothetical protein